jgi:hypothetical protein
LFFVLVYEIFVYVIKLISLVYKIFDFCTYLSVIFKYPFIDAAKEEGKNDLELDGGGCFL